MKERENEKLPVVAVVVVVTELTELSVDVVVAVDCDSVMKVVGVVALSKTYTVTLMTSATDIMYGFSTESVMWWTRRSGPIGGSGLDKLLIG